MRIAGELVVASDDAAEVLEGVEGGLNAPAVLVASFVVADKLFSTALA